MNHPPTDRPTDRRSGSIIRIFSKRFRADEGKKKRKEKARRRVVRMEKDACHRRRVGNVCYRRPGHEATKVKIQEERRAEFFAAPLATSILPGQSASQPRP